MFKAQLHSDPSAVVFQETGIYWNHAKLRHNSPDVTVILGVKKQKRWTSFYVAGEKVRPELVIEFNSPALDCRTLGRIRVFPLYACLTTLLRVRNGFVPPLAKTVCHGGVVEGGAAAVGDIAAQVP